MTHSSSSKSAYVDTIPLVVGVRFQPTGKIYLFDAAGHRGLRPGDFVLIETTRGQQLGEVVIVRPRYDEDSDALTPIERRAFGRDLAIRQRWKEKEAEALAIAREVARELDLSVKIALAEYTFDGERLTLLYASDDKNLDLGELHRQLQHKLSIHVDLRRLGTRDQAKLLGGYGACGEPRCCSRFMSDFRPISIRMAKKQGVSLSPSEITGMCGRLRCCLAYEHEQYVEACRVMPRRKKRVLTPYGEGKVVDLLPLKGVVVVRVEDRRVEVPVEDVELISG